MTLLKKREKEFKEKCKIIDQWVKEGTDPVSIIIMVAPHLKGKDNKVKPEHEEPVRAILNMG